MSPKLMSLKVVEGERRVDSRLLAEELCVDNSSIVKVLKTYKNDFEEFGVIGFEIGKPKKKSKGGRPEIFSYLNREQSHLYLTYSKNTPEARQLKKKLVRTFAHYEKALASQSKRQGKLAWQQARVEGKNIRHEETDVIQRFVEYAIAQGSSHASRYYVNFTRMTYSVLFFLARQMV